MRPATLSERLLAAALDLGVWSGIAVLLLSAPVGGILWLERSSGEPTPQVLFVVFALGFVALVVLLVWCVLFDVYCYRYELRYGATLGKGLLGLSVRDARTGALPSREQCLWREVTRPFEMGTIVGAMVAIALDPRNRRVGDRIAGTEVVESPSELGRSPFPWVSVEAGAYRSASAKGNASFGRRLLATFVDYSIVTTFFAPIDLALMIWDLSPAVGAAMEGNYDLLANTSFSGSSLWVGIPLYFLYERWAQRRFGDTPGRKMFGLRRELPAKGVGGAIRYALVPLLLFPVTLVEALFRRGKPTLSERLSGARFDQL